MRHFVSCKNTSKRVILFYLKIQVNGGSIHFIKPENVQKVLQKLNSFHRSLKFTLYPFPAEVHFLDIKIEKNKTDIFRKDTHTGQYVHFTSFEPWYRKTAWIKCLVERAERICSNKQLFEKQISKIKSFMSWNGYPSYVRNSILKKLKDRKKHSEKRPTNFEHEDIPKIWFRIPYIGPTGEKLAKRCIAKLRRNCKKDVRFILMYDTKKSHFSAQTRIQCQIIYSHI